MMIISIYLTCSLSAHHYLSDPGSVWVRRRKGWVEEGRKIGAGLMLVYAEWERKGGDGMRKRVLEDEEEEEVVFTSSRRI